MLVITREENIQIYYLTFLEKIALKFFKFSSQKAKKHVKMQKSWKISRRRYEFTIFHDQGFSLCKKASQAQYPKWHIYDRINYDLNQFKKLR